jgi:CRISPR/Cas system-associated endonuclease Cas1
MPIGLGFSRGWKMKAVVSSADLKSILLSKRANLYYLEFCRVLCNGGRVEFVTDEGKRSLYWNIPIANTTTVLLGNGTSITQAAMRELAKAGVLVGFCGGGGTPLFSANEMDVEVAWFSPQSEYRPTDCRIGSSEKQHHRPNRDIRVHCRIGSSEIGRRRSHPAR